MKSRYYGIILVILLLSVQTNNVFAGISTFVDKIDDVIFVNANGKETYGITTYPEIDFNTSHVKSSEMILAFEANVINDIYHYYTISVWWNGEDNDNITIASFGRGTYNSVKTYLVNASTEEVIVNNNVTGIIIMSDNELNFPIPNASLIAGTILDDYTKAEARCDNFTTNEYYYDEFGGRDKLLPGYTFVISLIGISSVAIAIYFVRKYKKSGI